ISRAAYWLFPPPASRWSIDSMLLLQGKRHVGVLPTPTLARTRNRFGVGAGSVAKTVEPIARARQAISALLILLKLGAAIVGVSFRVSGLTSGLAALR